MSGGDNLWRGIRYGLAFSLPLWAGIIAAVKAVLA